MQDHTAFDADFACHASKPMAVIVPKFTNFLGIKLTTAIRSRPEHDKMLPRQPLGRAGASQQLAVQSLYASSVAPRAEPGMAARMGGIERCASEESPSRRAGFHGLEHLLGLVGIGCQIDRRTHLLDQVLVHAAEHDQSLGSTLEIGRDICRDRWSPRR